MKKWMWLFLCLLLFLSGCNSKKSSIEKKTTQQPPISLQDQIEKGEQPGFHLFTER